MPAFEWKSDYELEVEAMDDTHREFGALVNALDECPPADALARMDELIDHTVAHFGQEDVWMEESEFPPLYCHRGEHERVLEVLKEVRSLVARGDDGIVRTLVRELPLWFAHHAATMDAALADHMKNVAYVARAIPAAASA